MVVLFEGLVFLISAIECRNVPTATMKHTHSFLISRSWPLSDQLVTCFEKRIKITFKLRCSVVLILPFVDESLEQKIKKELQKLQQPAVRICKECERSSPFSNQQRMIIVDLNRLLVVEDSQIQSFSQITLRCTKCGTNFVRIASLINFICLRYRCCSFPGVFCGEWEACEAKWKSSRFCMQGNIPTLHCGGSRLRYCERRKYCAD